MSVVFVVVAPLPHEPPRGRERVELQRLHAREAVRLSAVRAGARLGALEKDAVDAPLPSGGWHWSLSHSATWVAGVVHSAPLGVDVEEQRAISDEVAERVLDQHERALIAAHGLSGLLRAWTAKEAVLKEFRVGLTGLERCRIQDLDLDSIRVSFDGHVRRVRQWLTPARVVALSTQDDASAELVLSPVTLLGGAREAR